jgi:hypothetical protein
MSMPTAAMLPIGRILSPKIGYNAASGGCVQSRPASAISWPGKSPADSAAPRPGPVDRGDLLHDPAVGLLAGTLG